MSASSKKKLRKEEAAAKLTEKQLAEQKEAKKLNLYTTAFVVVLALLLVVAIVVGVKQTITSSGIREKNTVAVTIGDHEISNAELSYFYIDYINNYYSSYSSYLTLMGLDVTVPLDEQVIDESTGTTWADDFLSAAEENARSTYALVDAAEEAGFALSEEELQSLDTNMQTLEAYALIYGYKDSDAYLKAMYGNGANAESYLEYCKLNTLANAYYASYAESLTYDDAALRAAEAENYNAYSSFTYNYYYLAASKFLEGGTTDADGNTTYSDDEKAASVAAAEEAANSLIGDDITTVEQFDAAIAALSINEGTEVSSTAYENQLYASVSSTLSGWVTDSSRQEGDKTVIANTTTSTDEDGNETTTTNGYYAVFYTGSNDNTMNLANVRHILVAFEGGTTDETTGVTTYSDEEKAAAKTSAEEILAEWEAGDATEESFAELANTKSADSDGTDGGLYENVYPGQMVTNFNDWCFDESRKAGDTGIVESEYGYHVMFYSGDSELNYRDYQITTQLRNADLNEWYTAAVETMTLTEGNTAYIRKDLVLSSN